MSSVSRIFVVEGDESLNQSIVNALRKDGYLVQGVLNGADAVRTLWSEAYDIVLCDLKTPGIDGVELLQWLRSYHPHARTIIVGDTPAARMQVLESGAASYLEKPLDFRKLKEELRRLLQQSGFSASLDSFDLLDVIQIITMSRKSIAMLVSIGVEEQGILRFHNSELIWAEYGALRGEEAFFALAAHKNGTVTHHPWDGPIVSNVTQPLSRLILQALQYRAKYAQNQQQSTEHEAVSPFFSNEEIDDTPFVVVPEEFVQHVSNIQESGGGEEREWWEKTGTISSVSADRKNTAPFNSDMFASAVDNNALKGITGAMPASLMQDQQSMAVSREDLPSWLTDQPTAGHIAAIRPTPPSPSPLPSLNAPPASNSHTPSVPTTPIPRRPTSPEVDAPHVHRSTDQTTTNPITGTTNSFSPVSAPEGTGNIMNSVSAPQRSGDTALRPIVNPEWQTPVQGTQIDSARRTPSRSDSGDFWGNRGSTGFTGEVDITGIQRSVRRSYNYAALVSALQTLGYSISGFIAAAVVSMDGQPIAQVAVDDLDISNQCKQFSQVLKNALQSLDQSISGDYEDMVISSSRRRTLIRLVGSEKNAFLVLITMREADAGESLEVMANVEGAITSALRP